MDRTLHQSHIEPIDYLVVGHITQDLTNHGYSIGGTATFSSLTAKAMGLRVGIVTSINPELPLDDLDGIAVYNISSETTTTFKNIYTGSERTQFIYHPAKMINASNIPTTWLNTPIVHLGPVAQEIDPNLPRAFQNSFIGLTPQGWLRSWDQDGLIHRTDWIESTYVLEKADAAVLSIEDVYRNDTYIQEMVASIRTLAVTEAKDGACIYWNGDVRRFRPPTVQEVDSTGAGDIFAAVFFIHLHHTKNPWEAARLANLVASSSVTRSGLKSIPPSDEIESYKIEVLQERSFEL